MNPKDFFEAVKMLLATGILVLATIFVLFYIFGLGMVAQNLADHCIWLDLDYYKFSCDYSYLKK
mgnify:CR=1 FL=1